MNEKIVAIIPLRGAGGLDRAAGREGGDQWSDAESISKAESSE